MPSTENLSIIDIFLRFASLGAEWVMWLLLAIGFISIVLALERARLYSKTRIDASKLARILTESLQNGDLGPIQKAIERGLAMEERVLSDILEIYQNGPFMIEQILHGSLLREKQRYEKFLNYFGTIGNNAPFIGLFGTVIGIIVAFQALGQNPKGGLEIVGPGIAESLVATAVGLLVAIPAVLFYNFFKGALKTRISNTEFLGRIVLAHTQQKALTDVR